MTTHQPKYKQIIAFIELQIQNKIFVRGSLLPSINDLKSQFKVSRDTVLTALVDLKTRGIIQSIVGKGYFVLNDNVVIQQKIFVLFDELNSFKEDLYNSFLEALMPDIQVDIYFHHFNEQHFDRLIAENNGNYAAYIIMPANLKNAHLSIQYLPTDKVYILDQINPQLIDYPAVYQYFEEDIYNGLSNLIIDLKKYQKLVLITSKKQPEGFITGFSNFCNQYHFDFEITTSVKNINLQKNHVYIVFDDKDLIVLIKNMKGKNWNLKTDIGIISYNETLLKEVVEGGITTITTDFVQMGKTLAKMVLQKSSETVQNPSIVIKRESV